MTDDSGVQVIGDDVLMEFGDDGCKDRPGGVGSSRLSPKAVDLHPVQTVGRRQQRSFSIKNGARAGKPRQQQNRRPPCRSFRNHSEASRLTSVFRRTLAACLKARNEKANYGKDTQRVNPSKEGHVCSRGWRLWNRQIQAVSTW